MASQLAVLGVLESQWIPLRMFHGVADGWKNV